MQKKNYKSIYGDESKVAAESPYSCITRRGRRNSPALRVIAGMQKNVTKFKIVTGPRLQQNSPRSVLFFEGEGTPQLCESNITLREIPALRIIFLPLSAAGEPSTRFPPRGLVETAGIPGIPNPPNLSE